MKRFIKGCFILMFAFLIIGVVMGGFSYASRDAGAISSVVEKVTHGKVEVNLDGWKNFGIQIKEKVESVDYDIETASHYSTNHDSASGDVKKFAVGEEANKMNIEVGGCKFTVAASENGTYYAEAKNVEKLQCYIEQGELILISTTSNQKWDTEHNAEVVLYVPRDAAYESIILNMGAGSAVLPKLSAKEMELEVGAGKLELAEPEADLLKVTVGMGQAVISDMRVATLDGEVDMGSLEAEGYCQGNIRAKCAMGSIEMKLEGKESDYNYELSGAMGTMKVGSFSSKGMANDKTIDNGADKTMEVECSMGSADISFR